MTRVSTFGNYQSALLDLMRAQTRAQEANMKVSTQKTATDLKGFGRQSETLTAMRATQSRLQGFIDSSQAVAARLTTQDIAMDRIAEGVQGARQAIADALAAGRLDGLMQQLQEQFQIAQNGLNAKHHGRYLFGGGKVDNPPVNVSTMAELAAAADPADVFDNDTLKAVSRLDEGASAQTGFLADELGTALMSVFRDIMLYNQGTAVTITAPDGSTTTYTPPAPGTLNGATGDEAGAFLTAQLSRFDRAYEGVINAAALNGALQNRVDTAMAAQTAQMNALEEMIGKKTDADLASALTDLEMAQVAIQASAQVINGLRQTSLLDLLRY